MRQYLPPGKGGQFYYSVGILPTFGLTNMTETAKKQTTEETAPPARPDYTWVEDPGELDRFFATQLFTPLAVYFGYGYEFGGNMVEARLVISRFLHSPLYGLEGLGDAYAGLFVAFGAQG